MKQAELERRSHVSETSYSNMRRFGTPLKTEKKIVGICRALGWTDDSLDRLLRGEPPELVPAVAPPTPPASSESEPSQVVAMLTMLIEDQAATGGALLQLSAQLARISTHLGLPNVPPEREFAESPEPTQKGAP